MPQNTFPANFQVKFPSACQSVCQVPSQLKIKEGEKLKFQRNNQAPSQGPHQLMCQIYPSRYKTGFTRDMPCIMSLRYPNKEPNIAPGFGYSSWNPSGIPSDNTTNDNYPVPIINLTSVASETPTRYNPHMPKEVKSVNTSNMLIEYKSGDPTGAPSTMPTDKPI